MTTEVAMPNTEGTPRQTFRLDRETWNRFGDAAEEAGRPRSELLVEFVRWYIREKGATMPRRPQPPVDNS
jgi:hypothetical protein